MSDICFVELPQRMNIDVPMQAVGMGDKIDRCGRRDSLLLARSGVVHNIPYVLLPMYSYSREYYFRYNSIVRRYDTSPQK